MTLCGCSGKGVPARQAWGPREGTLCRKNAEEARGWALRRRRVEVPSHLQGPFLPVVRIEVVAMTKMGKLEPRDLFSF